MKRLLFVALLVVMCSCRHGDDDPRYSEGPVISPSTDNNDITALANEAVTLKAFLLNPYGYCQIETIYTVKWTDAEGHAQSVSGQTSQRTFRALNENQFYDAVMPGQDTVGRRNLRVEWYMSAQNEYGLGDRTDTFSYTVMTNDSPTLPDR